jgi:vacuolar-type H+-ATPase subunit C/Vma6
VSQDYTYIVARLRAIEAGMPEWAWFQRLARTPEESMLGAMRESYAGFEQVDSLLDFEKGIEASLNESFGLVDSLIADRDVLDFLWSEFDFDNLVHAWKANMLGREVTLNPYGIVAPEVIAKAAAGEGWFDLPAHLVSLLERFMEMGESLEPFIAEQSGERAKWQHLLRCAPGERARSLVRNRIDLINIKTFVRFKRSSLRKIDPAFTWIDGGEIEPGRLAELLRESEDELYSYLAYTSYRGLVRSGLGSETPLWKIDPMLNRQYSEMLGESRYRFFDLSPVLYHIELLKTHAQLVRLVCAGKQNRLPDEMILERLGAYAA